MKKTLCIIVALVLCAAAVYFGVQANQANTQLTAAKTELETSKTDLAAAQTALETAQADLEASAAAAAELETVKAELETAKADLETAKADLETAAAELATANERIAELEAAAEAAAAETAEEAVEETAEEAVEETAEEAVEETAEEAVEETAEEAVEETAEEVAVMTYAEYAAAALDSEVVVETYVQAKQGWWEDKATIYTQDEDGAYFIYDMPCSQEDYDKLTVGTKIRVTGYKTEWSGEVEIVDATFEIIEGNYVAEAMDATELLGTDELINHQNKFVSFKGMTVEASTDAEGNEVPFLYSWDGSGDVGNDVYFNVSVNGQTYNFLVESYLTGADTDVYKAAQALNIGDVIDMEGFLYWYDGVNPHITAIVPAA